MLYLAASRVMALGLLLLVQSPLAADDVQSWTDVELGVFQSDRLTWTVEGVARIRNSLGSVYDRRIKSDLELVLTDGASVTLGYILLHRTRRFPAYERLIPTGTGLDHHWDHRLHAGVNYPLLERDVRVEGTTLYERHIGRPGVPDFNRYRQQVEVERPRARVSPWLYQSVAFERRGFVRSRSRVGIRWSLGSGHSVIGAYQFERIKSGATWRPRHAVLSAWSFDLTARETGTQ